MNFWKRTSSCIAYNMYNVNTIVIGNKMCLWNTDVHSGNEITQNLINLYIDPARSQGHAMWVKWEQPLEELTVQIW